jgi:hypothetical protein
MRTTLDLASPVLEELKSLRDKEGGSLGSLASRLLAEALTAKRVAAPATPEFRWESQAMSANVNLADKEAVYRALDGR